MYEWANKAARLFSSVGFGVDDVMSAQATGGEVYGVALDDAPAERVWRSLLAEHPKSGLLPFLSLDSPEEIARWSTRRPPAGAVAAAVQLDPGSVIAELIAIKSTQTFGSGGQWDEVNAYNASLYDAAQVRSQMISDPVVKPWRRFSEIGGRMRDPVWICLVAAGNGYELPHLLDIPYANDWYGSDDHERLTPADHAGVLQSWQERFGAQVMMADIVSLTLDVPHPPTNLDEQIRVAIEQFAYCDDLDQYIGETHRVAQQQTPASRWYFWWD